MSTTVIKARRCCNAWLAYLIVLMHIGNASCLALRVENLNFGGPQSQFASLSSSSPPSSPALIHSIRQKGGITQRVSWNEQDHFQHQFQNLTATSSKNKNNNRFRSLISFLRSTFLPVSYPHQMASGYMRYAIWSWTQDVSTQLRSVLATQRVLQGVGVGRSDATALSALYNFMLRDGCGMLATLVFTAVASSNFGTNVKLWRLFADIMVDIGITLEVLAVGFLPMAATITTTTTTTASRSPWFLPMICVGNMCKAMCGVAAGACSGAIHLHWATPPSQFILSSAATAVSATSSRRDSEDDTTSSKSSDADCSSVVRASSTPPPPLPPPNIADIQAKFNAQHTVTASVGLVMAAWFAKSVSSLQHGWHLGILYTALTVLHLYANVQCLRSLALTSFNPTRFAMVIDHFMEWWYDRQQLIQSQKQQQTDNNAGIPNNDQNNDSSELPTLPTPADIAKAEPLLFFQQGRVPTLQSKRVGGGGAGRTCRRRRYRLPRILLGVSFPDLWQLLLQQQQQQLLQQQDIVRSAASNVTAGTAPPTTFATRNALELAKAQLSRQNYLLVVAPSSPNQPVGSVPASRRFVQPSSIEEIAIAFGQNVTARQMAKAYLEAHVLWARQQQNNHGGDNDVAILSPPPLPLSYQNVLEWEQGDEWERMWQIFQQACAQAGWNLDATQLPTQGYQIEWQ